MGPLRLYTTLRSGRSEDPVRHALAYCPYGPAAQGFQYALTRFGE
jgi:hypothetical protein